MNLTFSPYQDSDISQMSVDDAIVEALESDNLTLQNMSGGKYVQVRPSYCPWSSGRLVHQPWLCLQWRGCMHARCASAPLLPARPARLPSVCPA